MFRLTAEEMCWFLQDKLVMHFAVCSADYNNSVVPLIESAGSVREEWRCFPVAYVLFGQSPLRKQNTVTLTEGYKNDALQLFSRQNLTLLRK